METFYLKKLDVSVTKCEERWEIRKNNVWKRQRRSLEEINKFLVVFVLDGVLKRLLQSFL